MDVTGYQENFVSVVDEDFKCFICHFPLREPFQTRCGHRFCRECLEESSTRVITNHLSSFPEDEDAQFVQCPVDNVKLDRNKDVFPDKATERKILSFIIQCPNNSCKWTGTLGEKEKHMESCLFLVVTCTNDNCNETMMRKDLDKHVMVACHWRIVQCSYCSEPYPQCQEEEHIGACKKCLVECPAACGVEIPREKILEHTGSDCPLISVSCPFSEMGCQVKVPRNQIETHLESASRLHLDLACFKLHNTQEEFKEKTRELEEKMDSLCRRHDERISGLERQLLEFKKVNDFLVDKVAAQGREISGLYVKPPQLSWRINGIEKILIQALAKRSMVLESPPFYSANHGYKLKLCVYPNGDITNKHNYLSVFLVIVKGEYDAVLSWPFHQRITFILIDQQEESSEKKNITMELVTNSSLSNSVKLEGKVVEPSVGFARFVAHKNLKTRRYILNDSLLLQVEVHPPN